MPFVLVYGFGSAACHKSFQSHMAFIVTWFPLVVILQHHCDSSQHYIFIMFKSQKGKKKVFLHFICMFVVWTC